MPPALWKPPLGTPVNLALLRELGVVGYWAMQEGAGNTVYDLSGNANNGTLGATTASPAWSVGTDGPMLTFDGSNDKVTLASCPITGYPHTLMTWIVAPTDNSKTVDGLTFSRPALGNYYFSVGLRTDNFFIYYFRDNGSQWISAGTPTAGNLYCVAGVSSAANAHELFVNGVSLGTSSTSSNPASITAGSVGWIDAQTDHFGIGSISRALACNRALTAAEIRELSENPNRLFVRPASRVYSIPSTSSIQAQMKQMTLELMGQDTDSKAKLRQLVLEVMMPERDLHSHSSKLLRHK